jgi:DNA-binding CsgD family transcriptional regulator
LTVLIGRNREIADLTGFLERAFVGGGALLVTGDPGIGKTALIEAVAAGAGATVLRASGAQFEAEISFAALNQLLLPLHGALNSQTASDRLALGVALGLEQGPPPDRFVVSTAMLSLLRDTARERPVLLLVDDLPWLDRASAVVLGFVARRLTGSRVALLAAARTDEETFFERTGILTRPIEPLDEPDAARLLAHGYPDLPSQTQERIIAAAQGNPLALHELAGALPAEPAPDRLPLNRRLQQLFTARVVDLPAPTRQLLLLAALDTSGQLDVLRAAAPRLREMEDLGPAERAHLIEIDEEAGRLAFRHPLTRSAVVEMSTSDERRAAHRALAGQLTGQPVRRAWHLAEAATEPDERIAVLLEGAARVTLRRGDGIGAVTALLRAADLSEDAPARSRRMAEAALVGADINGAIDQAPRLLADARRADPGRAGSLQAAVAAAVILLNGDGDIVTAHRLLAGGLEAYDGPLPADDHIVVAALWQMLQVCQWAMREDLWAVYLTALARLEPRKPAPLLLQTLAVGDPVRAAAAVLPALDAEIRRLPRETDLIRADQIIRSAVYLDRIGACREPLRRITAAARSGGAVGTGVNALLYESIDDYFTGRWDAASASAEEGLELCQTHGYDLMAWPLRLVLGWIAAARGNTGTAHSLADDMTRWAAPRLVRGVEVFGRHVRGLAALAGGDFDEAYRQLAAISPPGTFAPHVAYALWTPLDLVEAAVRSGRRKHAAAHVAAMREAEIATISPRYALYAAAGSAVIAEEGAAGEFARALAIPGAGRWPFEHARVRLMYGERLRRDRATTDARAQLTAAREEFGRLEAGPWADRADSELRAAGAHRGDDALTNQERQIATLAASGLSNKQIADRLLLSQHTVRAHLYRAYPKLGVTNRAALRDALRSDPE